MTKYFLEYPLSDGHIDHFSAQRDDGSKLEFYRVVITEVSTNGLAPWNFAGAR